MALRRSQDLSAVRSQPFSSVPESCKYLEQQGQCSLFLAGPSPCLPWMPSSMPQQHTQLSHQPWQLPGQPHQP